MNIHNLWNGKKWKRYPKSNKDGKFIVETEKEE